MSDFNSLEEDRLIWTKTKDEILKRWELYSKWNIVNRIATMFGSGEEEKKKKSFSKPDEGNDNKVFNRLETLFGN